MRGAREAGIAATALFALALAHGQEAAEPAKQDPETPAPEQAQEEEAPVSNRLVLGEFDLGFLGWDIDGNRHKFLQYGTPPERFFLSRLLFWSADMGAPFVGRVGLRGFGEEDRLIDGALSFGFGETSVRVTHSRNRFFDPTPVIVDPSDREITEVSIRQALGNDAAATFLHKNNQQDQIFVPPFRDLHQRTHTTIAAVEGKLGPGWGSLSYSDFRYFDRTNALPDSKTRRWQVQYILEPSDNFSLGGTYARADIEQTGLKDSKVTTTALAGNWSPGPGTDVSFGIARDDIDLPNAKNESLRERTTGRVRLTQRWDNWSAQVSYKASQSERVRSDLTYVDVPRHQSFDVRLTGRLQKTVRVSLRGQMEGLDGTVQMVQPDSRPLYYRRRSMFEGKIEAGSPELSGYLAFRDRKQSNTSRDVEVRTRSLTLGGNWQVQPGLEAYAEVSSERMSADGALEAGSPLDHFFPDGRTDVIGVSWAARPDLTASVDYSHFVTNNANPFLLAEGNVSGTFLTTSLNYRHKSGYELNLSYAPWRFEDRLDPRWDYDAYLFRMSMSGRF